MKEYSLSPATTIADLVGILTNLVSDAKEASIAPSLLYAQYKDEDQRVKAMYFMGQCDILETILWAIDGQSEVNCDTGIQQISICLPNG